MRNLKRKIGYKVMAMLMVVFMLSSMIPASVTAFALDAIDDSPFKATNFTAVYNSSTDAVDLAWDAFETAPYELWVCVDGTKTTQIDATATEYSCPAEAGGDADYSILAFVDEYDTDGVESDKVNVIKANTFESVPLLDSIEVENNTSLTDIFAMLPEETQVKILETGMLSASKHQIKWDSSSASYDRDLSTEQTFVLSGVVVLGADVSNRNNLELDCSVEVTVKAAEDVAIITDLDDVNPVTKHVGEELTLSVEVVGTAPAFQWYVKTNGEGTAIDEATDATLTIKSLVLDDAAQYYCVVTGKNGSTVTSKVATVNVSKVQTNVDLSITPDVQTRPDEIILEAIGIPDDAAGKLIFKEGDKLLSEITLPNENKTTTFKAYGANNSYNFTVIYDAGDDNAKYFGSEKTYNNYCFNKGSQTVTLTVDDKDLVHTFNPDEEQKFTVKATSTAKSSDIQYEFAIIDEIDAFENKVNDYVASIDKNTGEVTIKAPGTFKITVKALSNDDYNESSIETSKVITIERAQQGKFEFIDGDDTVVYTHDFAYSRPFAYIGDGDGKITFKLGSKTTAKGIEIDPDTGVITFVDNNNDNNSEFNGKVGVVEVIASKAADRWWKPKDTAPYVITIIKAEQGDFKFENENPDAITYTANNGTTFTNVISTDYKGSVYENNKPVYEIISQSALPGDAVAEATGVASINSISGEITALRSGVVTVKATLPGNGVYNSVETTYNITINRGTVAIGENADDTEATFGFNLPDSTIKYGTSFQNIASGGQSDTTDEVTYTDDSDELTVSVNNGVITFDKSPAAATEETYSVTITATKPETDKYNACSVSYTLTVTRDAVNPTTDFTVNEKVIRDSTLDDVADGWYNAEHKNITIKPNGNFNKISVDGNSWEDSIVLTDDAKHNVSFYLKDSVSGNTSCLTNQNINYDTTKATATITVVGDDADNNTWADFFEIITFGLWKNESKEISIVADDNLSGIKYIEYFEQNDGFDTVTEENVDALAWTNCDNIEKDGLTAKATINVELEELSNKKVVVYAKVTDVAGNISYFRTNGMVFDNITPKQETTLPEPIIEITLDESTTEGLYNSDVPFTLTVNDEQTNSVASGIEYIIVTIKGSENEEYEKVIKIDSLMSEISSFNSNEINPEQFTVDGDFVVPAEFDSNYITIRVEVKDYAGNVYVNEEELTRLAIDDTDPVISVSYNDTEKTFSNGKYIGNNQNRIATIDITELNFVNDAVVITVTKDGKPLDIKPAFKPVNGAVDENGDQIGWRMIIDYSTLGQGDFTFDIAYSDKANNTASGWIGDDVGVNKAFTIDNTKPIISVVITNDAVVNGKYFADFRTATVTIVERNFSKDYKFDWSGLTYSLDGQAKAAPKPVLTKNDAGTYKRVYTIPFSAEGDYTFDVKYTDLADNIASSYSCSSVAYKEFTIDKTAPELEISGVANYSANKDTIAPVITYSDINFNKDNVSIELIGVNNGKVNYNGNYSEITHGQVFTYNDFVHDQQVDDIYTLTVRLTDMAGNSTTKNISFSANRFGSVYDLTDIESFIKKYHQNERDIVFSEINVDSLVHDTIKIVLGKNDNIITLVEGKDYTVEKSGGNGQWSVYKYIIKKSLFADDALYSLKVESKDAAGNLNESDALEKIAEISFGIDKTKPIINSPDLIANEQYAVDGKSVTIEIKDNLLLDGDSVLIYLNDGKVDYTVEGNKYTFYIPESNKEQSVKIVACDAAGNEFVLEIDDFLVNTNFIILWFYNTPFFIGTIVGFAVVSIGIAAVIVFGVGKKKKKK